MNSSTEQSEEAWGEFRAHTDILSVSDGGRIAATCVTATPGTPSSTPVILLPGMFSNRHFWVSPRGVGLAAALARAGSPVWLIERRELGRSPVTPGTRPGMEQHLRLDLPVVQAHVQASTPGAAVWGGHSFGGVIAARAVAETLDQSLVAGLLLFAAQIEVDKRPLCWPWNLWLRGLARLCGRLPARRMGLGPEDEPVAAVDDACFWRMDVQRGGDLLKPLAVVHCPVLAFAGGADDRDPPAGCARLLEHFSSSDKRYVLLSRNEGYSQDYDHPGIVVSKPAAGEVWPKVVDWLPRSA